MDSLIFMGNRGVIDDVYNNAGHHNHLDFKRGLKCRMNPKKLTLCVVCGRLVRTCLAIWQYGSHMAVSNTLRALLDALEEPRMVVRSDFSVAYANRAFRERFGAADFAGRRCHELLFHELSPCSQCGQACPMERAALDKETASVLRRELIPGGERLLSVSSTPLPGPDGEPVLFMETVSVRGGDELKNLREGIVANSLSVRAMLKRMARAAPLDLPVLFQGEAGSGKECFARTLHENSRRAAHPFIVIGCEGLTRANFDDELLGRVGPNGRREGGLSQAQGGTLYFDEVLALSPAMQQKLLLLMEWGIVRAEGAAEASTVDFRIFCATKHDLLKAVQDGSLRRDLYYRLSVCTLRVPALRERTADIEDLSRIFLARSAAEPPVLSSDALSYLTERSWPGNVRELSCLLERAALFGEDRGCITRGGLAAVDDMNEPRAAAAASLGTPMRRRLTLEEAQALRREAASWQGSRKALAERAGVSERTLYRILAGAP